MVDPEQAIQHTLGGDFEILRRIGEGSKSFVYLARERALRRLVAIKVLQETADDETRKRFAREGRAMAKIRQRNVISVHRVGELDNELPFIVMEYVDGRTLRRALEAQGTYSTQHTQEVLVQVAAALHAAHQEGIIHRDLRPDNVIEEADTGRIVLTDFGLAGLAPTSDTPDTNLTMQGQLLGDPRYVSPEQLQGDPVTPYTDSYSLGILGYELLTLRLPYEAKSNVEMLTAHLRKQPIALAELRPEVDPVLAELLSRCLRKNPEQRPTPADIEAKLEVLLAAATAVAEPGGTPNTAPEGAFKAFTLELSRRHVVKVLLMYIGIGGPIAALSPDILNELTWLPPGIAGVIITLFLIGLPVTAVLAWVYDVTSEGIKRTADYGGPRPSSGRMRALKVGGSALTLAVMGVLGWWFFQR